MKKSEVSPQKLSWIKKETKATDEEIRLSYDELVENDKLAEWVMKCYNRCKEDMTGIRNQWYLNLAFYKGDQYVQMIRGKLIHTPPMSGRVRMRINRIRPAARTEIARMTSQKPTATVLPASADDDDILAAEAGEAVWEMVSEEKDIQSKLIQAAFWGFNTGIGYLKAEWDSSKPTGQKTEMGETVLGDHVYTAPTPFHIFVPDGLEQDIEDQSYVIHTFTKTLEEVREAWGDKIPANKAPTVRSTSEILQSAYLNMPGNSQAAKPDSCLVMECWVKPGATPLLPKGGLVIVVDDVVVYKDTEGIPFEHGQYPFAKIDMVPSGGYFSTSPIEDLIPIQKEINRNRSHQIETRNLAGKPGYTYYEGSLDPNKWRSKPGQLIGLKPGFNPPTPLALPQLPQHISEEHQNLLRDFEDISGQHQVSKGSAPSGVTAATAISFLQEQDESYMYTVYYSIEKAMQKIAHQTLMNSVQYWDEPRLVRSVGRDNPFSAKLLTKAELKGGTDIRMDTGSAMPVSKAARNALFMDLMSRGLIDAQKGLEYMNLPNMRKYYDDIKVDEKHATRENLKLRSVGIEELEEVAQQVQMQKMEYLMANEFITEDGQPDEEAARNSIEGAQALDSFDKPILPVNDWDNHEVHIFIHEKFMKSQAFEVLPELLQQEFIKHVQEHKNIGLSAQLTQMMQNGTSGGQNVQDESGNPGGFDMAAMMGGGGAPMESNNAGGANQFSGIEEPVDGNTL